MMELNAAWLFVVLLWGVVGGYFLYRYKVYQLLKSSRTGKVTNFGDGQKYMVINYEEFQKLIELRTEVLTSSKSILKALDTASNICALMPVLGDHRNDAVVIEQLRHCIDYGYASNVGYTQTGRSAINEALQCMSKLNALLVNSWLKTLDVRLNNYRSNKQDDTGEEPIAFG